MKEIIMYTDGACSYNPGPGGYCAILFYNGVEKVVSGGETQTTNNRMELLSVINGLKALKERCLVKVHSDSAYVVNAYLNGWIFGWQKNGWKNSNKEAVKNSELWQELLTLTAYHKVEFVKVKGHSDNENNNRCDKIAREEILKLGNQN